MCRAAGDASRIRGPGKLRSRLGHQRERLPADGPAVDGKQRTAAGICEREQIARVANAAHQERPANSYELRRTCAELCVNIEDVREQLSWALNGNSAEAIKSHRKVLLSEVERIEGPAA